MESLSSSPYTAKVTSRRSSLTELLRSDWKQKIGLAELKVSPVRTLCPSLGDPQALPLARARVRVARFAGRVCYAAAEPGLPGIAVRAGYYVSGTTAAVL